MSKAKSKEKQKDIKNAKISSNNNNNAEMNNIFAF